MGRRWYDKLGPYGSDGPLASLAAQGFQEQILCKYEKPSQFLCTSLHRCIIDTILPIMIVKEEQELIQRVAQGDRDAFLKLYDRYAPRVHGLSLRMLGDMMLAEEVTQDSFMKLWTRASTFRAARGSFLSWLLTITRHTAIDRIRLEARRPAPAESIDESTWDWLPDPDTVGEEARWRTLRFALGDLPTEQSLVIELAFYHGLSQSQIAEYLNIPLGTVKTRIRLGMEKLHKAYVIHNPVAMSKSNSSN